MTGTETAREAGGVLPFLARFERFERVGSTNDIVGDWLAAGVPEVCVAVADEQTAGRGREGRTWTAPPGAALLLSAGFRPSWLTPDRTWRLGAIVALSMARAADAAAGLASGTVLLKWPNDLVVLAGAGEGNGPVNAPVRKLAGLLGETVGLGTDDPRAIIGIGTNADWPADAFPPEIAASMTSLRELAGRPIDREALLATFLGYLETAVTGLRDGWFDEAEWAARQVTTGRIVRLEGPAAGAAISARALGVDTASGALLVEDLDGPSAGRERIILTGEVTHLRLPSAGAV